MAYDKRLYLKKMQFHIRSKEHVLNVYLTTLWDLWHMKERPIKWQASFTWKRVALYQIDVSVMFARGEPQEIETVVIFPIEIPLKVDSLTASTFWVRGPR